MSTTPDDNPAVPGIEDGVSLAAAMVTLGLQIECDPDAPQGLLVEHIARLWNQSDDIEPADAILGHVALTTSLWLALCDALGTPDPQAAWAVYVQDRAATRG
jgi:hypothetical protein